ncbi:MAG: hypothetical protein D6691_11600 [Candidatus Hydrogenedentota bacterium]|uniref:Uncharacterized protein n=1 Tax=Sumerlaea chitinivorans TaxID=2250252 RepID=A0A2Z4Y6F7_SUMC1|nr:hypothetical protein BRCON_1525 [Candidatus Sumerlaea chitinivorans]RMH24468.1 MAG: hypothetical protein D6691_11600 [Candidatus Hydrogenedentota bacterium]GIX45049.1 MAG: hypothetical protein KatS3mg130_1457 [Candidatus Sumerlaea sp.]
MKREMHHREGRGEALKNQSSAACPQSHVSNADEFAEISPVLKELLTEEKPSVSREQWEALRAQLHAEMRARRGFFTALRNAWVTLRDCYCCTDSNFVRLLILAAIFLVAALLAGAVWLIDAWLSSRAPDALAAAFAAFTAALPSRNSTTRKRSAPRA